MSLPLALRTFQVPWPTQVKLTSALSAMPFLQFRARPEKRILPHAQHEDADRGKGPEVGKDELAWLPKESEQEDPEQNEHPDFVSLDAANDEKQNQRQEREPLVWPHLIGYECAESKPERHPVSRIPLASPGAPRRAKRESERAQIGERERNAWQVHGRGDQHITRSGWLRVFLSADGAHEQRAHRVVSAVGVVRGKRCQQHVLEVELGAAQTERQEAHGGDHHQRDRKRQGVSKAMFGSGTDDHRGGVVLESRHQ